MHSGKIEAFGVTLTHVKIVCAGRYSDENGRLNSWWSVPTLLQFTMKAQCFVKQYDNYRIPELEAQLGDKNHVRQIIRLTLSTPKN